MFNLNRVLKERSKQRKGRQRLRRTKTKNKTKTKNPKKNSRTISYAVVLGEPHWKEQKAL